MREAKRGILQKLRDGPVGRTVDSAIEATDQFLGPSGKAWLANGLDELRQAVALGTDQIQAGNNPGLWGSITTGEATAERLAGDRSSEKDLHESYEVPKEMSLDELRGYARDRAKAAENDMNRDRTPESRELEL